MNPSSLYCHIVAASKNNVIGMNNTLPWDIPEDLEFFKATTKDHTIIMGRKTFESLGKPLPKRLNIVISRNINFKPGGVLVFPNIKQALEIAQQKSQGKDIFIIGGGEIYKQSMDLVHKIYLTRVHQEYSGDAHYPMIPLQQFKLVNQMDRKGSPPYSFLTYQKKNINDKLGKE